MNNTNYSRKYTNQWYNSFDFGDTCYYGVFLKGKEDNRFILVDPIRWQKNFHVDDLIKENMEAVMSNRKGPLFQPKKKSIFDYNINVIVSRLNEIRREWENTNKPIIDSILSEICGTVFAPYDDDLAQSGILDPIEAAANANMKTWLSHDFAKQRKEELYQSLYAQFFHQMVSQIEALCIMILTKNGFELKTFC